MKDSKITGWQDVFRFTFVQTMLEKSTRIFLLIMCFILFLSVPVATFVINQIKSTDKKSNISTVYIKDETSFTGANYGKIAAESVDYAKVKFVNTDKSLEKLTDLVIEKDKNSVVLHIFEEDSAFHMNFIKNPTGAVKDKDSDHLIEKMKAHFEEVRLLNLKISQEQYDMAYTKVSTNVYVAEKDGGNEEKKAVFSANEVVFLYAMAVIPFFMLVMSGSMVASSIITEKSSKVIEYLMISIRPLAIIVGKVLAMFCVIVVQFSLMGIFFYASTAISRIIFPGTSIISIKQIITPKIMSNLNISNLFLMILMYVCGFLFYSVYAALFGATVSKIEELQEGLSIYSITAMVGFYLAYILAGMNAAGNDGGVLVYVATLLPISAPFIVPAYLLLGKISLWIALSSLVIQILTFVILTLFVSKVYETLILHNGNRIKMKDLIRIFKNA